MKFKHEQGLHSTPVCKCLFTLLMKEVAPIPLPPHESGQIAMDEKNACVEMMGIGSELIKVRHNLAVDASEAGLGNTSQPVDDPTSGCAL